MNRKLSAALALSAIWFAGCGDASVEARIAVDTVTISSPSNSLRVLETLNLNAAVKSIDGQTLTDRDVEWSSSNMAIATVGPAGNVTGVAVGAVTITATSEGKSGLVSLTINPAAIQSIALSAADSTFNIMSSLALTATVTDATGAPASDRAITWTTTGSEGAAVSASGVVTATRAGPVTVTATVEGKSASVTLGAFRSGFVTRLGSRFMLDGKPYFFGGTNSYWVLLEPTKARRETAIAAMKQSGARVLRLWGSYDRGSLDGSVRTVANSGGGLVLQRWDPALQKAVLVEGPDGLQRLDEAVAAASVNGVRLIISLVDNWPASGGMDQYVIWYGGEYHDEFYTDARIKQAYKNYVQAILTRVNPLTGIRYSDDPTILAWELANEPGCSAKTTGFGSRPSCSSTNTIEPWMAEMSAYIKSLDPNHLVGTGEIGMMNRPQNAELGARFSFSHWPNFEATVKIPTIDFGTYHFYLHEDQGTTLTPADWAKRAINEYQAAARVAGKPAILEEFDDVDPTRRVSSINAVLQALEDAGGAGFLHYQFGMQRWCSPACSSTNDVWPGTAAFDALKTWNARFNARTH